MRRDVSKEKRMLKPGIPRQHKMRRKSTSKWKRMNVRSSGGPKLFWPARKPTKSRRGISISKERRSQRDAGTDLKQKNLEKSLKKRKKSNSKSRSISDVRVPRQGASLRRKTRKIPVTKKSNMKLVTRLKLKYTSSIWSAMKWMRWSCEWRSDQYK